MSEGGSDPEVLVPSEGAGGETSQDWRTKMSGGARL